MKNMTSRCETTSIGSSFTQSILAATTAPGILSLAMGLPDPAILPSTKLAVAANHVLLNQRTALQYSLPSQELKQQICRYMLSKGLSCTVDQILLTQGAQQALRILVEHLADPTKPAYEEHLTYSGYQQVIDICSPTVGIIPCDPAQGLDINALAEILSKSQSPSLIYLMPTAHNPTSVTLSAVDRIRLAELARNYQIPIIEDDPYSELYYESQPPPPLRAFCPQWVYYVGSFSKLLGPSLRIGWIVAESSEIAHLSIIKNGIDLDVSTIAQRITSRYLETDPLPEHAELSREFYRERRECMSVALARNMPSSAKWLEAQSGLFFWIELPDIIDTYALLHRCLEQEFVGFFPGAAGLRGQRSSSLRLNFSNCRPKEIEDGVSRISRVIKQML